MTREEHGNTETKLVIPIIIIRAGECFNTRFKLYSFSYQSLNGIYKVQSREFVFIGIGLIGSRPSPSRRVQQVQNYG